MKQNEGREKNWRKEEKKEVVDISLPLPTLKYQQKGSLHL